jgi:hypothetical protein
MRTLEVRSGRLAVLGALAGMLAAYGAAAGTNSWTSTSSGNWEDDFNWSLSQPPGSGDSVLITNGASKIVSITTNTPDNFLTVSNLTLGTPNGSTNTLDLDTASSAPPVEVLGNLFIQRGGAINVHGSSLLQVDGLTSVGTQGPLGGTAIGNFTINSGVAQLYDLVLGEGSNSFGALNLNGGVLTILNNFTLANQAGSSTGTALVSGGTLLQNSGAIGVGGLGNGTFTVRGGSVLASGFQLGSGTNSHGTLTVSNALVVVTNLLGIGNDFGAGPCSVTVSTGGSLFVTNASHSGAVRVAGNSSLLLRGGLLQADNLFNTNGGVCDFTNATLLISQPTWIENGSSLNVASSTIGFGSNLSVGAAPGSTGTVFVTSGGILNVTNGTLGIGNKGALSEGAGSGSVTVANAGINAASIILGSSVGGVGSLILQSNAVVAVASDLTLLTSSLTTTSSVTLAGGSLLATNGTARIGASGNGRINIYGGSHMLREIDLGSTNGNGAGALILSNGHLTVLFKLKANYILVGCGDLDGSGGTVVIGEDHDATMEVTCGTATNINTMLVGVTPNYTGNLSKSGGYTQVTNMLVVGDSVNCVNGPKGNVNLLNGCLAVTNSSHNAVLDVRNGTVTLNGGTLIADTLDLSHPCGHFSYLSGAIHYNQLVLPAGAPPLRLNITYDTPTSSATLSWPSVYVGYILQQTPTVSPTDWTTVGQTPTDDGTTSSVTISSATDNMFYRLSRP